LASVISSENVDKHNINKYNFKVLSTSSEELEEQNVESVLVSTPKNEAPQTTQESDVDSGPTTQGSKDSLIESLLQKTDEMSSNFIKLQMKLETMTDEHKKELEKVKEESFAEGVEAGRAQAAKDAELNMANALAQYTNSISTLENSAKEFERALEGIKKELIAAAIDISKEVINVELSENSSEVATVLSNELIKELQSASKVTLKVNPKDHGVISERLGSLEHVEVVSDSAIQQGGVIAISDAGNIDAQISKRFERVKIAALNG